MASGDLFRFQEADLLLLLSTLHWPRKPLGTARRTGCIAGVYRRLMPWIETIHEDEWEGTLADLRQRVTDPGNGRVDWIMRVHSLDPGSLEAHDVLYRQAMKSTATLRKVDREMIALVVSDVNGCDY